MKDIRREVERHSSTPRTPSPEGVPAGAPSSPGCRSRWRLAPEPDARRGARSPTPARCSANYLTLTKPKVQSLLLPDHRHDHVRGGRSSPGRAAADLPRRLPFGRRSRLHKPLLGPRHRRADDATADRPIPSGRVSPRAALIYGRSWGCSAFWCWPRRSTSLAAGLSLCASSLRRGLHDLAQAPAPQNIVIGAPRAPCRAGRLGRRDRPRQLDGRAAVRDRFYWTPPHFWALSLLMKNEYAKVKCDECRSLAASRDAPPDPDLLDPALRRHAAAVLRRRLRQSTSASRCAGIGSSRRRAALLPCRPPLGAASLPFSLAYLALLFVSMVIDRHV